jgi:hypothetical protein
MNDNKSYIIDAQELVDIINKKIYLKKCRRFKLNSEVSDDLKAKLDGYESEIRDRMSKSKGKSESSNELRSKFSAGELDTIDKIVDEIEKFKEIIGGKCDQGSDLGAAEAAHLPLSQAPAQALQVVSPTLSPLESKVSDFISNSLLSNPINSPNPTDNLIDKVTIINSTIDTPNSNPINTPTISDCINTINTDVNTINTDVNTINTGNNSSNRYYSKVDISICNSRCNSDNPSISDTTHIKTVNSSSNSDRSTNSSNMFKRFIKAIKSIFKTTRYN